MPQKKIKKLMIMIIIAFVITAIPVLADDFNKVDSKNENIITPYFTYISSFTSNLSISNGIADISVFVSSRNCDRILIKGFLQRYESGSWTTIKSWSLSQIGTIAILNENYSVNKGYQYRLLSNCEVYNNTNLIDSGSMITDTVFW